MAMMNGEAGGPSHLKERIASYKERIASYIDGGGRNGTLSTGQSDLSMSAANTQPARIFIVEDDPIMRGMIVDYLEEHNMRAVSASGGKG